jgi:hypothetical protein
MLDCSKLFGAKMNLTAALRLAFLATKAFAEDFSGLDALRVAVHQKVDTT